MSGMTSRACPVCDAPTAARYRPFCSKRCADVDLHRWLSGAYATPALDEDDAEPSANAAEEQNQDAKGGGAPSGNRSHS